MGHGARTNSGEGGEERQVAVVPCRPVVRRPELYVRPRCLQLSLGGVDSASLASSSWSGARLQQRGRHFLLRRLVRLQVLVPAPHQWVMQAPHDTWLRVQSAKESNLKALGRSNCPREKPRVARGRDHIILNNQHVSAQQSHNAGRGDTAQQA